MEKTYVVTVRSAKQTRVLFLKVDKFSDIVIQVWNYFDEKGIFGECPYIITEVRLQNPEQYFNA